MVEVCDVAVVGGGIVGLATAMALTKQRDLSVVVLEAEDRIAAHQTGHNSGVIHSGLYYKPGSAKARNCAEGRDLMYRFCAEHGIRHERCGKLVVATEPRELPALDELERRGRANGLTGIRRLDADGLMDYEPNIAGIAGLFVAETGIIDYKQVSAAYAAIIQENGGDLRLRWRVVSCRRDNGELVLGTTGGDVRAKFLINCAGLQSDRVARVCGVEPGVEIIPFRGEYYELVPAARHLVRNLIYPVPDPNLPFLGVHFTRMIGGGIEAGPNAVLAFRREGYRFTDVSFRDLWEMARFRGFWKMARRFWRTGAEEVYRSLSQRAFWHSLQKLVPAVHFHDIIRAGAGVRAQAVDSDGKLVDDFRIATAERMIHVLNAPSPGATASIAIGRSIAAMACENGLTRGSLTTSACSRSA
jgi:L-2-hydroxyglutarate oxidase